VSVTVGRVGAVRIVGVPGKIAYVVLGYAAVVALNTLLLRRIPFGWPGDAVAAILEFALFYLGTRVFRGRSEDRAAARAPWRMTARPLAGFVIASLLAAGAVSAVVGVIVGSHPYASAFSAIEWSVLAVLYLRSSFRLRAFSAEH